MQVPLLDLKLQYKKIEKEVEEAARRVLRNGYYILGPNVEAFESEIAQYCSTKYAVGVASGTDALRISLAALGVGKRDEVITTPFTFIATTEAITQVGDRPVFVDIDEETFNIDPAKIRGWMCEWGIKLEFKDNYAKCRIFGREYLKENKKVYRKV